jgi:hypothetical protein
MIHEWSATLVWVDRDALKIKRLVLKLQHALFSVFCLFVGEGHLERISQSKKSQQSQIVVFFCAEKFAQGSTREFTSDISHNPTLSSPQQILVRVIRKGGRHVLPQPRLVGPSRHCQFPLCPALPGSTSLLMRTLPSSSCSPSRRLGPAPLTTSHDCRPTHLQVCRLLNFFTIFTNSSIQQLTKPMHTTHPQHTKTTKMSCLCPTLGGFALSLCMGMSTASPTHGAAATYGFMEDSLRLVWPHLGRFPC